EHITDIFRKKTISKTILKGRNQNFHNNSSLARSSIGKINDTKIKSSTYRTAKICSSDIIIAGINGRNQNIHNIASFHEILYYTDNSKSMNCQYNYTGALEACRVRLSKASVQRTRYSDIPNLI